MRIFDTLAKRKVNLQPSKNNHIGIYLCGPTVYDYGHLGHGRSAIVFDVLRRYLTYKGFDVTFVRNWTDIDDKTIERAEREGVSVRELTEKFIDPVRLLQAFNAMLSREIAVIKIKKVSLSRNARYSTKSKVYKYLGQQNK